MCCAEGTYCTPALDCAYSQSATTSRPSTSDEATETSIQRTSITKATASDTGPTSAAIDENKDTPGGGLSQSDKIAIGVGLGVGIPTMLIGLYGVYQARRRQMW
jgi:predicted ATP-dependent serine protease